MWSIGKVVKTPEVLRVYVGSFWDQPLMYQDNAALFEMEERDLMADLKALPRNNVVRKINELVKRVRIAKVHCYILSYLREQMPMLMGHSKTQKKLIADMPRVFRTVMKKHNLSPGDFPNIEEFQFKLSDQDFTKFHHARQKLIDDVESVLSQDFPRLMEALPRVDVNNVNDNYSDTYSESAPNITYGNVTVSADTPAWNQEDGGESYPPNPFNAGGEWSLQDSVENYLPIFDANNTGGFITGTQAKSILSESGLSTSSLRKIWDLADMDKDGQLDLPEFVVAMHLADLVKGGSSVPKTLDKNMIPIEKRNI